MIDIFQDWLFQQGLSEDGVRIAKIAAAILASILIAWLLKHLTNIPLDKVLKPHGPWIDSIKRHKVPTRVGWVIGALVAQALVLPLLDTLPDIQKFAEKFFDGLIVVLIAVMVSSLITASVYALEHQDTARRMPLKGFGQALQLSLWVYVTVALLAVYTEKDLGTVLASLTAIGAILVYVFRDTILGWSASVQIAANDLVAEGNWISLPKYGVSGSVEEITLTVVKVRNWDNTITSLPIYSLYSEGFTNWRGMWESEGRFIQRSIAIDATSVGFCDEALLETLNRSPLIRKLGVLSHSQQGDTDPISLIRPTNLGCFRAWLQAWLTQHPKIRNDLMCMVREREPGARGIPVEICAFSTDQSLSDYENVAGEIFDHVLSVLPLFDLRIFQEPSGADLRALSKTPTQ